MSKINALEAAAKATHPGKWSAVSGHLEEGGQCAFSREHALSDEDVDADCAPEDEEERRAEQDAAFIALASPDTVLALIGALRAYEELLVWHRGGHAGCNPELDNKAFVAMNLLQGV